MSRWATILAGGSGTRFWPLSTDARPKQFIALAGGGPLLSLTAARLETLIDRPPKLAVVGALIAVVAILPLWLLVLPLAIVIALIRSVSPSYTHEPTGEEKAIATIRGWLRMPFWPFRALAIEPAPEDE